MLPISRLSRVFVFALLLIFASCEKRAEPIDVAQRFFQQIAQGDLSAAYALGSFAFQTQQTEKAFAARVKELTLVQYEKADWSSAEIDGRTAKVKVTVATKTGAVLPYNVTLIDEGGAWRIFSLKAVDSENPDTSRLSLGLVGNSSTFSGASTLELPEEKELLRLTREALLKFNTALQTRSFDEFYGYISRHWRDQSTQNQIARAFQPFIDNKVDLGFVAKLDPKFQIAPFINGEGLLVLKGIYPNEPVNTEFELTFVYELPKWKLLGLEVALTTRQ